MDTIILILIFSTFVAMRSKRRWLVFALYFASLTATLLLFNHHVTDKLPLSF